jgi:hypothetical protein
VQSRIWKRRMGETYKQAILCPSLVYCNIGCLSTVCVLRTGIYTVKGQTYLQGKIHEEKIRSGMPCEVFVEVCPSLVLL